jgi:hypothetical protein
MTLLQVHQAFPPSFVPGGGGHLIPGRFVGDFNNANQTNVYVLEPNQTAAVGIVYTPLFAAAGFRYAKVLGLPDDFVPTLTQPILSARFVHTDVRPVGRLQMAPVNATPGPPPLPPLPPLPPAAPAVCGAATELTGPLLLGGCPGGALIKEITFVSYGNPSGDCSTGFFADSACDASGARAVLDQLCIGKASCTVAVSNGILNGGVDPCRGKLKALAVLVRCVGAPLPPPPAPPAPVPGFPSVLNAIHEMTRRSQLSNLWSVPSDCPQRERRGWMGDAQVSCDEAMLSFDMQAFYRKYLRDVRDDQTRGCQSVPGLQGFRCPDWEDGRYNGSVADVVPYDGVGGWPGCVVWQVAYIVIARTHWRHYGDAAFLAEHWDGMVALMGYFERHINPEIGLNQQACYGDWVDPGGHNPSTVTPASTVTAFYYVLALGQLSEMATALGRAADAQSYGIKHNEGVRSYHKAYYDAQAGGYSPVVETNVTKPPNVAPNGSQTSNAMALILGAPQSADATGALAKRVAANLVADVEARGNHSFGGIVGQRWIYPALEAAGYGAHALATLLQDSFPSFGRMAAQTQTTLCENWACEAHDPGGGSLNHMYD